MAPTLIGMFQAGKFLPPQLNLVLELEFAEPADALRPGGGSTDYSIENVRVLASQVTLDSALYESYQKILLSGRSLVFAYPMHTQVSSIPAGSTSHNVTVARAFTKLLGAFVSFRDIDDASLGECSNFEHPGDGSQFSTSPLESQMQLGALQYPRTPHGPATPNIFKRRNPGALLAPRPRSPSAKRPESPVMLRLRCWASRLAVTRETLLGRR